jgi:drug/metabolite transporter (DMT)-like permease
VTRSNLLILFMLGLIWGSSFLFIKVAVGYIPPFTLAFGRLALAAMSLFLVLSIRRMSMPAIGPVWAVFFIMGLLNGALPYTLINFGEVYIDSGLAAILNASMPIFTIVLAHLLTDDEALTWERLIGVFVGLVGVAVLVGPEALHGISTSFLAQMAVVAAAISYALAAIVGRKFLKSYPPIISATGQLIGGTFLVGPISLLLDTPWTLTSTWSATGALICLSLLNTCVAYLLYFHLLKRVGATNTSLVTYLIPVTGVMWGAIFLGERLHWRALMALALILFGIAGTTGRLSGWSLTKKAAAAFRNRQRSDSPRIVG